MFRLLSIVLVTLFISEWAGAQSQVPEGQRIIHESWTFKEGAPEGVSTLAQTADGYLWLGTPNGLFRFDGVRFELFHPSFGDPLPSNNIASLFAPRTGGLWIGYRFGSFSFLKSGKLTNFSGLVTGSVNGFAQDRHGIVWAATNGGVWRFDGSSWRQNPAGWDPQVRIVAQVGFDLEGILWALTDSRSSEYGRQLFYLPPDENLFRKAGDKLATIGFTWNAEWVLTTHERTLGEPGSGIELERSLPAYPILKANSTQVLDRANGIWFFPLEGPPYRHSAGEPLAEMVSDASPGNSQVYDIRFYRYAMLVDREGSLWTGDSTGVHRFSYSPLLQSEFSKTPDGPNFALAPDEKGTVWISAGGGTGSSALYRVADGKAEFQSAQPGLTNFAYRAADKTYWFGGEGGLWQMVEGRLTRIKLPPETADRAFGLITITQDTSGGMWVSFGTSGLYRLQNGVWTKYGGRTDLPTSGVIIAFTDGLGRVWFGSTQNRLAVLDGDRVRAFGPKDGVQVGNVLAIYGRGSEIWIGGEFGLQQFDRGKFHRIRAVDTEALRGISGIVQTKIGDLWLNGLGGIIHLRAAEVEEALKDPAHQASGERFGRRQGLPGLPSQLTRMPTAIEGTDGRLWFTLNNGVVWIDPAQASNKIPPPPVSIETVSADDKPYQVDSPIRLRPRTSSVQISFAAVSLSDPEAIHFRYKLQEADHDWHEIAASNSVTFRNLPPGSYHFVVNGTDTNGLWSDNTATAAFTVLPAYYQTSWFGALCGGAFLALLWAAYRFRVRQLERELSLASEARLNERTRIARELHDTLLQSVQGVMFSFQAVRNLLPNRTDEAISTLDNAIREGDEAIAEGRDAIQGLRVDAALASNLEDLLTPVGTELARSCTADGEPPGFRVIVEGERRRLSPVLQDEVYRIAREILRNAYRHAHASRIEAEIVYDPEFFRLRIRDNGRGIDRKVLDEGARPGHWGWPGVRERANRIGAQLKLWSEKGAGTEVDLTVPARIAYGTEHRREGLSLFRNKKV